MFDTPDDAAPDGASDDSRGPGSRKAPHAKTLMPSRIVRHMPAELRQRRFSTAFRGFDRAEVLMFLTELADDFEQALHEIYGLEREVDRVDELLVEHREREQTLRNTLLTAQRMADDIRTTAEKEGREIVRDAEARADLLIQKAETRLGDIDREIELLRARRRETEAEVESSITSLQQTLDGIRAPQTQGRDDRIRVLRPRHRDASSSDRDAPRVPPEPFRREGQS